MALDVLTDEELVVAVRERDRELYAEVIRRYEVPLSHYLRKFIRVQTELEDVLQDVFIKAFRNLNSFDSAKRLSPWLYRIARNEAINYIKKNRKGEISLDAEEIHIADRGLDIPTNVDGAIDRVRVERAISSLKEKYRDPLLLYFFEQKTYDEISDILRLPRNTVGTRIARAKEQLKKLLQQTK